MNPIRPVNKIKYEPKVLITDVPKQTIGNNAISISFGFLIHKSGIEKPATSK